MSVSERIRRLPAFLQHMDRSDLAASVLAATMLVFALVIALRDPVLEDTAAPDFTQYEAGAERKQAFFDYFLPLVEQRNDEIRALREDLQQMRERRRNDGSLSGRRERRAETVAEDYGLDEFDASTADGWQVLMRRVDIVPPSLALAQAANESAWGTSRFAREGNNYYGHWCFQPGCGLIPRAREAGASHEVAEFSSPEQSVERYIHNLNEHEAYTTLRMIRAELRQSAEPINGMELAAGLTRYSERGQAYISELREMIRFNELARFDPQPPSAMN